MVGTSHESENYDRFTAKRINFDQQENMSLQLGSAQDQNAWSEGNQWTINSFFSRVNYTFAINMSSKERSVRMVVPALIRITVGDGSRV